MKYIVTITTADHVNGHEYSSARAALTTYNNIREIYARAGYIIADAGKGHNSRAELWIKEGRADRNIEIWPVAPRADRTHAADFLTAQKFASEAAAELSDLLTIDENRAAHLLTSAAGTRIFEVTHGRAESVRTAARHAADKIAAALNIETAAAADLLAEVLTYWHNNTAKHTTPAEVLADYNENKRREDERAAAAKVLTASAEVLGNIYGNKTRAEVLAALLNCNTEHAADLLDEMSNTTDRANVPDWTRYAYELAAMKRGRLTFGQAAAKVAETRAKMQARQHRATA